MFSIANLPKEHFLRRLNETIGFSFVNDLCKDHYCADNGRPSWEPQINDRMSFKYFLGLAVNEKGPGLSTLFKFRDRLGPERFGSIFNRIVEVARSHKLVSDKLYIVDSTEVQARVNRFRITEELKQSTKDDDTKGGSSGPNSGGGFTTPDPDARFGCKSKNRKFFGYKEHLCMDAESEIIVGRATTPGNEAD